MAERRDTCKFDHCENDVKYPVLGVCATCYSGLRLWVSRSAAAKRHRMSQYDRMKERMDYLMAGTGIMPGYTKTAAGKRKAKELEKERKS